MLRQLAGHGYGLQVRDDPCHILLAWLLEVKVETGHHSEGRSRQFGCLLRLNIATHSYQIITEAFELDFRVRAELWLAESLVGEGATACAWPVTGGHACVARQALSSPRPEQIVLIVDRQSVFIVE